MRFSGQNRTRIWDSAIWGGITPPPPDCPFRCFFTSLFSQYVFYSWTQSTMPSQHWYLQERWIISILQRQSCNDVGIYHTSGRQLYGYVIAAKLHFRSTAEDTIAVHLIVPCGAKTKGGRRLHVHGFDRIYGECLLDIRLQIQAANRAGPPAAIVSETGIMGFECRASTNHWVPVRVLWFGEITLHIPEAFACDFAFKL